MKISSGFSADYVIGQYASTSTQNASSTNAFQTALNGAQAATNSVAVGDKVTLSAQGKAASSADSGSAAKATKELDAAAKALEDLLTYAKKTPAQLMREKILKQMNLTEEELKAMPAEKQMVIEKTIADKIKEMLENPAVAKASGGLQNPFSSQSMARQTVQSSPAGQLSQPVSSSASLSGTGRASL